MLVDGVPPANLLEDIEATFQARVAKLCKKAAPPSNGFIDDDEMGTQISDGMIFRAMGTAGTLVIFDSGGLHCGSRVLRGDRRVAKMTYSTNADIAPQPLLLSDVLTPPTDPFMREVLGI